MQEAAYQEMFEVEERHWWFRGRWSVVEALLSRAALSGAPRILDAGCGTGLNVRRYSAVGEVEGIDPSPEAVRFCHARGLENVREGGIESLPFPDAGFDLVSATDVLEHVADDGAAAAELLRVTAPGGTLLLTVPAYLWLWSEEDENLHHYRRYTRRRLASVLEGAGWRIDFSTYFNSILLPPIAAARKLPRRQGQSSDVQRTPAGLDAPLSLPMRLEAKLIRRGVSLPAGVSIGVLASPSGAASARG